MRRGLSLAEVLISLALISVMLALVALLCRDLTRDRGTRARVDSQSQLDLGLLRLGQEWKSATHVNTPLPGASSGQFVMLRANTNMESDPPQPGDRLPMPLPTPPLATWNSDDPGQQVKLRYDVDGQGLVRQALPGGAKTVRLAGAKQMSCRFLNDGRLQADFQLQLEGRSLQRSLTILVPVL